MKFMKMFKLIIILFIISLNSFSQKRLDIEVSNPEPRVNEYIELRFNIGMIDSLLNLNLDSMIINPNPFYRNYLEKSFSFSNLGLHKLGPFNLELNGIQYVSDSIFINVIDSLPKAEGIWLRVVKNSKNEQSIILEQIIKTKYRIQRYNEYGIRNTKKQVDRSRFNTLVTNPSQGIHLSNIGYMYYQYSPYEGEKNKNVLFYSRQIYKLEGDYKGILEINNDFFTKTPRNLKTRTLRVE